MFYKIIINSLFKFINKKHNYNMTNLDEYFLRWLKIVHLQKLKIAVNLIIPNMRKFALFNKLKKKSQADFKKLVLNNREEKLNDLIRQARKISSVSIGSFHLLDLEIK